MDYDVIKEKEKDEKRAKAQKRHVCDFQDCVGKGRVVATIGDDVELTYCASHRNYGEKIVKRFIYDIFDVERKRFINNVKEDLFKGGVDLGEEGNKKLGSFIKSKAVELREFEKSLEKMSDDE